MTTWTPEQALPADLKAEIEEATSPLDMMLCFFNIVGRLKTEKRTGWVNFKVPKPESIADHMYRMGVISMLTKQKLDTGRCVKMALIHDMAESLVGDITPVDPMPKEEKHRRELITMEYLGSLVAKHNPEGAKEMVEIWNEYENCTTAEARFVKDVDKYELLIQTVEYEKANQCAIDLSDFTNVRSAIKTEEVSALADELLEKRRRYWASQNKVPKLN